MFPSALVTTESAPSGEQPWETTVRTSTPESRAPTAPEPTTSSSTISACASGPPAPRAIPPTIGGVRPSSPSRSSTSPAGNVNGSTSSATRSASSSLGSPSTSTSSSLTSASAWKVSMSAPGSDAAQTATAGPASTSRAPATTPCATQPRRCRGDSSSTSLWTAAVAPSAWCGERKMTARSTSVLTVALAARAASTAASPAFAVVESPAPIRVVVVSARTQTSLVRPPRRDDLGLGEEADAVHSGHVQVAVERALPAREGEERHRRRDRNVDADHAGGDAAPEGARGRSAAREDRARVAELARRDRVERVVERPEPLERQHRAEDLLLRDAHLGPHVVEDRRT